MEVEIAVRSEPYRPGDRIDEGDFSVVSSSVIPIGSTGGPARIVCNTDSVVFELEWRDVQLFKSRKDQHSEPNARLSFHDCRFRIKNQIVRPDGVAHQLSMRSDLTLDQSFDPIFSPLTFSSDGGDERTLVIRARLVPEAPATKPLPLASKDLVKDLRSITHPSPS